MTFQGVSKMSYRTPDTDLYAPSTPEVDSDGKNSFLHFKDLNCFLNVI